jgi:PAS domain S-box-containing protein
VAKSPRRQHDPAHDGHAAARALEAGEAHLRTGEDLLREGVTHLHEGVGHLREGMGDVREGERRHEADERRLRESEEQYRLLVEHVREYAIFSMDADRRVRAWNVGAQRIFGWTEEEILGQPGDVIFTEEDRAAGAPDQEAGTAVREGQASDDRWHVRKDGSRFWASGIMTALREEDGTLRGLAKILRDRTDWKQAEEALRGLNADLHTLNDSLEERVAARTAELARRTEESRTLASDLTLAERRERQQLAQVLHDHVQQVLFGAHMKAQFLRADLEADLAAAPRADLDRLIALLTEAIRATRSLTLDLSPPILREEGLRATLEWLALRMQETHGLRVHVEAPARAKVTVPDLRLLLFQLVRELLFNAVKHAGVQEAHVRARRRAGRIEVVVADAGRGFDPAGADGFGLRTMRERLDLLGGTLDVRSRPGAGTVATITLPTPA